MENKSIKKPINILIPVKARLRFREEDDLNLLREVAGQNPFEDSSVWHSIKENLYVLSRKDFSIKTLKDHLDLLIKAWLEKIKSLKDRSGIEEDYSEKDQLCQNIHDYMIQFRQKPEKKKNTLLQDKVLGKSARDKWASKLANNNVENPGIVSDNTDNFKENVSLQDHIYYKFGEDFAVIGCEDTIEIEGTQANLDLPQCSTPANLDPRQYSVKLTPGSCDQPQISIDNKYISTPVPSKVLRAIKTRKRNINVQRQGLNYLEKYDQEQKALKVAENKLEERRIALEEKKCALEEARLS